MLRYACLFCNNELGCLTERRSFFTLKLTEFSHQSAAFCSFHVNFLLFALELIRFGCQDERCCALACNEDAMNFTSGTQRHTSSQNYHIIKNSKISGLLLVDFPEAFASMSQISLDPISNATFCCLLV